VDYLKYDWCSTGKQNAEASYSTMRDALYAAGRPIVFSLCEWGSNQPWLWAPEVGNLWRTTGDIQDCFDCTINWGGKGWLQIMDENAGLGKYAGPGHWNDPDMLEVGNGGMSFIEDRAHFTMWCMMAAPLMAGNDLRNMTDETKSILMNKEVIALDQDLLGYQGYRAMTMGEIELWVKPLMNGDFAICFFNRSDFAKDLNFPWQKHSFNDIGRPDKPLEFSLPWKVRDLWQKKDMGTTREDLQVTLKPHDVVLYRLSK
jgi:alpha-galactosidase